MKNAFNAKLWGEIYFFVNDFFNPKGILRKNNFFGKRENNGILFNN